LSLGTSESTVLNTRQLEGFGILICNLVEEFFTGQVDPKTAVKRRAIDRNEAANNF